MKKVLDITEILKIIPHRYPFLLIDKIIDMTEKTVTAIKNVTFNENFFHRKSSILCPQTAKKAVLGHFLYT